MALKRLRRALEAQNDPGSPHKLPVGCMAEPIEGDLFHWMALIIGPEGTCYEDGHFLLNANFPSDYPFKPPIITFTTKIYHPRVRSNGFICLPDPLLRESWSPALTFAKLLGAIRDILLNPDVVEENPYNIEITEQFMSNRKLFDETAAKWVSEHAPPPKHPVIEHLKYEYSISEQHVLCTFNVSFARCELQKSETYHFRIQYNDSKIELELQRKHNEYSVTMPITMEYGGTISFESSLCLDKKAVPFTTQRQDVYLNALTDHQYVLLISGFWRICGPEMDINADLIGICHRFYDHPFEITMRWKIHKNSATFIEERSFRLTDAKDIKISSCKEYRGRTQCKNWIKETFLRTFGMGSLVDDTTLWKSYEIINVSADAVLDFMKAPYPKTVDVQMDFSKIACFDAKHENQVKRIAVVRGYATLSLVKKKVRLAFQFADVPDDGIQLTINGNCMQTDVTDHEMEIYLLQNEEILLCEVQIIPCGVQ